MRALRWWVPFGSPRARYAAAGALFAAGAMAWTLLPSHAWMGLPVVALGHLPLWVRRAGVSGDAEPVPEGLTWAVADAAWVADRGRTEEEAVRWSLAPWDASRLPGAATLVVLLGATMLVYAFVSSTANLDLGLRLLGLAGVLLVPAWCNGMRPPIARSALVRKADALRRAAEEARQHVPPFHPVFFHGSRDGVTRDLRLLLRSDAPGAARVLVEAVPESEGAVRLAARVLGRGGPAVADLRAALGAALSPG